ncbi:hypothetical protein BC833DRAFT_562522 [Globomyces pollinis-pini]|nr:hypothetical protein BC833DRAFT_562522 [Globomyces pollinis-pini]
MTMRFIFHITHSLKSYKNTRDILIYTPIIQVTMFDLFANHDLFSEVIFSNEYNNVFDPSIHQAHPDHENQTSTTKYMSDLFIMTITFPLTLMDWLLSYTPMSMKRIV